MNHGFLLVPREGEQTTRSLVRKVRLLALRHLLTIDARAVRIPGLGSIQSVLTGLARSDAKRLLGAIGGPDVLPLLLVSQAGLHDTRACLAVAIPHLIAALGALPEGILWDRPVEALGAAGRRWAFDPPALGLTADPSGLTVRCADGRLARLETLKSVEEAGLPRGLHLALADSFPLSMMEDHPDKFGNALDLGGRSVADWVSALSDAMGLIAEGLPSWAAELPEITQRVVPVGFHPEMHLSASYREAPGVVWMTLHPDPLTLAEALIHETQHGKLNALTWLDAVLVNGRTCWTESPVRPDLRPLMGVLLAVHAFVPVAELHRRLAHRPWPDLRRFERRRAEVLASNARGLAILEELGEPTALGSRLLADLRAMHDACVEASGRVSLDPEADLLS